MTARLLAVLLVWIVFPAQSAHAREMRASWYACCNAHTASGVPFSRHNPHIAAHKYLPFGEEYLLTNHKNGHTLCVSIEDRGPYTAGRDIDLTEAGAQVLGFVGEGTARLEAVKADCL